jgi:hypothetical protein
MNTPDVESDNLHGRAGVPVPAQGIIAGQLSVADSSDKIGRPAMEGSSRGAAVPYSASKAYLPMSERPLELTRDQQDLLLQGLRFVKSAVALDMQDYTPAVEADRRQKYARISELESLLRSASPAEASPA